MNPSDLLYGPRKRGSGPKPLPPEPEKPAKKTSILKRIEQELYDFDPVYTSWYEKNLVIVNDDNNDEEMIIADARYENGAWKVDVVYNDPLGHEYQFRNITLKELYAELHEQEARKEEVCIQALIWALRELRPV